MPLFRWKKTRRYEVSSRNSYVVCVHLLDTSLIECTLTADSVGYECLENIAQRIELNQLEYFGLRYVNKKLQFRWVELDKPLKKQLDKHAHSPLLYFGVMYYIPDAQRIHDDMTRYQYYLQLKSDVIDSKLPCTADKAVLLAAYSVQAELGDFDYERHTVENLKDIVLLPRNMTLDDRSLAELTQDIINNHQTLVGWSPATAEVEYILEAQQLEGYGMDYYTAKNGSGHEVLLGAYYIGIFVKVLDGHHSIEQYKWTDIVHLTSSKKHFAIMTPLKDKAIQFSLDDPDMAKYIHKIFSLQMTFYTGRSVTVENIELDHSVGSRTPDLTETQYEANTSQNSVGDASPASLPSVSNTQYEGATLQEDPTITVINTPSAIAMTTNDSMYYSNGNILPVNEGESQPTLQQPPSTPQPTHVLPTPQNTPQSTQYVGVTPVQYPSKAYVQSTPIPPSYRHTPDYETVMRQRMEQISQVQQHSHQAEPLMPLQLSQSGVDTSHQLTYLSNIINTQVYAHPDTLAYSQPEMHHLHTASHVPYYSQDHPQINNGVYGNMVDDSASHHYPLRPVDRTSSLIIYPTYASPEPVSSLPSTNVFSTSEHMLNELAYNYKPPPPYPRPSSSTPDLASKTARSTITDSPDLISHRHLPNTGLMVHSLLDQSVENLAIDTQKITLSQQVAAKSKQNLDDTSSIHSEAISYHQMAAHHAGSIPDVAHNAMLSQDYGGAQYLANSAHTTISPQSSLETPTTLGSGSSRSLPRPESVHVTGQPPDYNFTDPIAFDNPAFSENLKYYMGEVQASTNVDLSHVTAEMPQVVMPTPQPAEEVVTPSPPPQNTPPLVDNTQTNDVVLRKKPRDVKEEDRERKEGNMTDDKEDEVDNKRHSMGALKMAALNGLTLSRGSVLGDDESPEEAPRIPKDGRRRQLEAKLEAGQVFAEFENVHKKRLKAECSAASQPVNKERNRFRDVFPYDDNRIKLTPTKENPMGYINASSIKVNVGRQELLYIAAMGPLSNTVNDFWQMVWEQDVEVIAMLTKLQEHGKSKCHRYWPEKKGPKNKVQHAQYQIMMKFSNNCGPYGTSGLLVKHLPSNRERLVWHLQYTDWPDHGCPDDVHGFLAFLDEIEAVKRQTAMQRTDRREPPILTHCSAGVGRTGVVILTEAIKACLENNQEINVPGMLAELRDQRMYTVQTVSQYSFIYKTLIEYLKGSRLI